MASKGTQPCIYKYPFSPMGLVNKASVDKQGNLSRVSFLVGRWDRYQVWGGRLVRLTIPSSVNAQQ